MNESARTTIVGARPAVPGRPAGGVPLGIEALVKKAAVDPDFRAALVARRAEVAADIGLVLTPSEIALLSAVPAAQLEAIIANSTAPSIHRRAFLGYAGAAMLTALTAELTGCQGSEPGAAPAQPRAQETREVWTQVVGTSGRSWRCCASSGSTRPRRRLSPRVAERTRRTSNNLPGYSAGEGAILAP